MAAAFSGLLLPSRVSAASSSSSSAHALQCAPPYHIGSTRIPAAAASSAFVRLVGCPSAVSLSATSHSRHCCLTNSKASSSFRAADSFNCGVVSGLRLENGLPQGDMATSGRQAGEFGFRDRRRWTRVKACHGDEAGNNNIQFSSESESGSQSKMARQNHVPLYVSLPLDTVSTANTLNHVRALQASFRALKIIGVDGLMMHVWWGIVEGGGPKKYDWSAYLALVKMIKSAGLTVQASICFHGWGRAGYKSIASLPPWILSMGETNPDVFYTDRSAYRSRECLSLGIDNLPLLDGRSPVQIYTEFLESFRSTFALYLGNTIVELVMGMGPNGELRYPAFPEVMGKWEFPGVGEFQCYDKYMLKNLKRHAVGLGKPEWGLDCPHDSPSYNQWPNESGFCREQNGSWNTPYGVFFLSWYSGELFAHGDRMLSIASHVFKNDGIRIAGKVPGVHWWYKSKCHAAELAAGYYNSEGRDGYDEIARVFAKNHAVMILPCMEMSDMEQPSQARCSPDLLLLQIRKACSKHEVPVAGENSLPRFDRVAHTRIKDCVHRFDYPYLPRLKTFTFWQMGESLFYAEHWRLFVNFVQNMDKDVSWEDKSNMPPESGQDIVSLTRHLKIQEVSLEMHHS